MARVTKAEIKRRIINKLNETSLSASVRNEFDVKFDRALLATYEVEREIAAEQIQAGVPVQSLFRGPREVLAQSIGNVKPFAARSTDRLIVASAGSTGVGKQYERVYGHSPRLDDDASDRCALAEDLSCAYNVSVKGLTVSSAPIDLRTRVLSAVNFHLVESDDVRPWVPAQVPNVLVDVTERYTYAVRMKGANNTDEGPATLPRWSQSQEHAAQFTRETKACFQVEAQHVHKARKQSGLIHSAKPLLAEHEYHVPSGDSLSLHEPGRTWRTIARSARDVEINRREAERLALTLRASLAAIKLDTPVVVPTVPVVSPSPLWGATFSNLTYRPKPRWFQITPVPVERAFEATA